MLFFEKLEDVPEQFRSEYVESEFEGKKGYQHKKVVALANAYRSEHDKRSQLEGTLSEQEAKRQADIAKARQDALEEARKSQNFEEYDKRHKELLADTERRAKEIGKQEALKELAADRAAERKKTIIAKLSGKGIDDGAKEAVAALLERHIEVDPDTQKEIFLDSNGNAMAVDLTGFESEMFKMSKFSRLIEVKSPTSGAGGANGPGASGGGNKKPEEYTEQERVQLFRTNPTLFNELFKRA